MNAGGKIVAGTDTPNAINLHRELATDVQAGMTPYQALRAATVTPAEALALDTGSLQPAASFCRPRSNDRAVAASRPRPRGRFRWTDRSDSATLSA